MKRILLTTEKLTEKINDFKDTKGYVIYFDIMSKEVLKDKQFMSIIGDGDKLYELDNNIFFIRDAPIEIYKALVENIEKNDDGEHLINRLLPKGLYDFNKKIEYYTDDNKNDIIIKNTNI